MKSNKRYIVVEAVLCAAAAGFAAAMLITGTWDTGIFTRVIAALFDGASSWPLVLNIAVIVFCVASAYLLGSLNFAIMVSRDRYGDDIRKYGSHNAGMTNMFRVYGKAGGLLTLLGDTSKTAVAVLMARFLAGEPCAYIAGLFVVLGHIAPVWYKFKGGKGVLASAIAILFLEPAYFAVVIAAFLLVYLTTHYVSMGSVVAAFVYPAVVVLGEKLRTADMNAVPTFPVMLFAFSAGALIIIKHRANIRRVFRGEEKKMYLFKKKSDKKDSDK